MAEDRCSVQFDDVVQRFRVIRERPDTLREFFARIRRQKATYHDFEALKHVTFRIAKGEMVGIIGRNGSGKSTILKVIAGVYAPSSGRVEVHGRIAPLIELGAGFHHELTGRENILLNGLLLGDRKSTRLNSSHLVISYAVFCLKKKIKKKKSCVLPAFAQLRGARHAGLANFIERQGTGQRQRGPAVARLMHNPGWEGRHSRLSK